MATEARKRYIGGMSYELHYEGCERLKDDDGAQEINIYQWTACIARGISVCDVCHPPLTVPAGLRFEMLGDVNTIHHPDGRVTLYGTDKLRGPVTIELTESARRWLLASLKVGSRNLNDEE